MKNFILFDGVPVYPNDKIRLVDIKDESYKRHNGKVAVVDFIDDQNQVHCYVKEGGSHVALSPLYGDIIEKL